MLTPGVWAEVNMGNQHLRLVSQQSARAVHGSRITPMLVGCAVETRVFSALIRSLWVEHMPCGTPEITLSVVRLTIFDERRAEVPIGTI
jgi:hypothetical protein